MKERKDLIDNKYSYKHGESFTRLHIIWTGMKQRCFNSKAENYKNYGGRGITICPEWTESYIVFRDWALNNGYAEGLQINRIENDGNYEPSNCEWITNKANCDNRRKSQKYGVTLQKANEIRTLYNSRKYTQKELANLFSLSYFIVVDIINNRSWKNN